MKKVIYILNISLIISFVCFLSFADSDSYGTDVEYVASGEEEYNVTVPAKLTPGGTGEVVLNGTWPSNRIVYVSADESVELINSYNIFSKKKLNVNFQILSVSGNNFSSLNKNAIISIDNIDGEILFGDWKGTFNYNVEISDIIDTELYYGKTYTRTFIADSTTNIPEKIICYEDKSVLFVMDDGKFSKLDSNGVVIENNKIIYSDEYDLIISEDKRKVSMVMNDTGLVNCVWELEVVNDYLDSSFPLYFNDESVKNNTRVLDNLVRVSDIYLSEQELFNSRLVVYTDTISSSLFNNSVVCTNNKNICYTGYWDYDITFPVISAREAGLIEVNGVTYFVSQPGIYFLDCSSFDLNISFSIEFRDENYGYKWNTLEVMDNTKVVYNDYEFVKISDTLYSSFFFSQNNMNISVDGSVISLEKSGLESNATGYYLIKYGENIYQNVFLISQPGTYNGIEFSEPGIYVFNYGGMGKNYDISINSKIISEEVHNLKYNVEYSCGDEILVFNESGYISKNVTGGYTTNGRFIFFDNGIVALVSSDGKSFKVIKYLSSESIDISDDLIFTYSD